MAQQRTSENRLAQETSPYLRQHANNPVDWYPWGPEALERAEREDKPILLSVGYSACHWCHVMERESFENAEIARLMNASFVCIKVDREERPDIDDVYMAATVAITGSGGWPMTVFCTPEQSPFFAGTYFPPEDRNGRPGFATLLRRIAQLWQTDRDALYRQGGELRDHLLQQNLLEPAQSVAAQNLELATGHLARTFDQTWGGFGKAPKFPPSQALELLLRQHSRTGNQQLLEMVERTLDGMAKGGIRDHLGGGFARYSTDERWLVPHFEKMLYDNAQLARVFTHAFQVTKNFSYATVARETLDYVMREMQAEQGGYYSAQDADSEGEEGKYFVFTPRELRPILEPEEVRVFCAFYDVTEAGNWEGKNILHTPRTAVEVATTLNLDVSEFQALLATAKQKVLALRRRRVAPATDEKVLTGWNGLMISAMSEASRVYQQPQYLESALRAARYIWNDLQANGTLYRTGRAGQPHVAAVLEDYAYFGDSLVDAYEASADEEWLSRALSLSRTLRNEFVDAESGAFFQTSHTHEPLLVRLRDGRDGALPGASAVAARFLLRLSAHLDSGDLRDVAVTSIRAQGSAIGRKPHAFISTLLAVDDLVTPPVQLAFSGTPEECSALVAAASNVYLPQCTFALSRSRSADWRGSEQTEEPTLYVCRNYACQAPLKKPEDVAPALEAARRAVNEERASAVNLPPITGHATAAGTQRYLARCAVGSHSARQLGRLAPVHVSRLGFGTQRVFESVSEHQQALQLALHSGINLIDTAHAYGGGASERAVGHVVTELCRRKRIARDEIVVVTKLSLDANSPSLEQQLTTSLARLNLATVDVCLLHNPENLLTEHALEEASTLLRNAFSFLERAAAEGKVVRYGVSSHVLAKADAPLPITLLKQAAAAAGAARFELVEVPLNVQEREAAEPAWLQLLTSLQLQMLTHRALDTLAGDEIHRLFDAPEDPSTPGFATAFEAVGALEHEFRSRLGAVLEAVPDLELNPRQLFVWSERIGSGPMRSRERWNDFERGPFAKELTRVLGALDRAFDGKQLAQVWQSWRDRYTRALETLVLAARQTASEATNRRNRKVRETLEGASTHQPPLTSLAQLAADHASTQPLVVSTVVGMRSVKYVREMTELLRV